MKKFFPNIETAIIFVLLICIGLWTLSRCKKKKDEASLRTASEATVTPLDTALLSPAAARTRIAAKPNAATQQVLQPLPPQYQQTQVPLPAVPSNTPAVQPNSVPQSYSTTVSPPNTRPVPTPRVNTKSVPQATTPPPSNTMLYVLINGLNIRAKADLKAKIKGKLKLNEQVYFLEEATEQAQTVRLANGTMVTKPWFKIQTKRGTVGWVHGSGVDFYKRKPTDGL